MEKTPKEKAKELFDKYYDDFNFDATYRGSKKQSKQCALIAVDEIMKQFISVYDALKFADQLTENIEDSANYKYWQEVKQEINNL